MLWNTEDEEGWMDEKINGLLLVKRKTRTKRAWSQCKHPWPLWHTCQSQACMIITCHFVHEDVSVWDSVSVHSHITKPRCAFYWSRLRGADHNTVTTALYQLHCLCSTGDDRLQEKHSVTTPREKEGTLFSHFIQLLWVSLQPCAALLLRYRRVL